MINTRDMHKRFLAVSALGLCSAPSWVFAARSLGDILEDTVIPLLNLLVGFFMVVALLGFIYGAIKFIASADDERGRAAGKKNMVWGIVALVCMVAVWGIVGVIHRTFFG